ncbi:MAG: cytidine deaminase [Christensenellaceae bacterium]|jgi:dCMP deaminase|nr:cytidine deaminase [Christensenellaceae bacterium]
MNFTKQDYAYMAMAEELAKKTPCVRNKVGAVFVKDGKILISSYNGVISVHIKNCDELGGCIREKNNIKHGERMELCNAPCAETRCICEAARDGIAIKGATVYCSHRPCLICTRNLIATEVAKVIYKTDYPDPNSANLAAKAGLPIIQIK